MVLGRRAFVLAVAVLSTSALAADLQRLEAAVWEMERRGMVPPDFGRWMNTRVTWTVDKPTPATWTAPHFRLMQDVLDRVTAGELKRVMFQVPIRHGKTEHNTYGFGAYHFDRNPRFRGLLGSYNQKQADKFSRNVRKLVRALRVPLSTERDAASEWETAAGGGLRAVGAGSGVASVNADGIIIDDPIGSRDEAESQAKRDQVWDWLTDDILARAEPDTWVTLTMSRWHPDDPAGRLLERQADRWHVVHLPALAEKDDPLGRAEGEPLWPEERPLEFLEQQRVEMGSYGFASLLQGRPRPPGGGMFKWEWWGLLEEVPAIGPMVRYWDLAGTKPRGGSHDPDHTAGALLCRMPDQRTAIVHVERFRKSVAARNARMVQVADADLRDYGRRVVWWIESEQGIQGKERTAEIVRAIQNVGIPCYTEHPTGSKRSRAEPLAAKAEAGNALLCPGSWRDAFRLEASDFTGDGSGHDDMIDAASGADAKLAAPRANVSFSQPSI